jgi:hypothetical protein
MNGDRPADMDRYQRWREALQLAPNPFTVRGIVADYVQSLRPIMEVLPRDCRDALWRGEVDIQGAAVTLLQAEMRATGSDEERALLHEIAHTLASAAVRITVLHSRPEARSAPADKPDSAKARFGEA